MCDIYLFIVDLTTLSLDQTNTLHDKMVNELENIRKEAVMA